MADNDSNRVGPKSQVGSGQAAAVDQRPHPGRRHFVVIWGLFGDYDRAAAAFEALLRAGFNRDIINVMLREAEVRGHAGGADQAAVAQSRSKDLPEPVTLDTLLAGRRPMPTPDAGPMIVAGDMAVTLVKAASPADNTTGLRGSLIDFGVPAAQAEAYVRGVAGGGVLCAVKAPRDRANEAGQMLRGSGAQQVVSN
jgi:hypothetical protein